MDPGCILAVSVNWRMRRLLRVNLEVMGLQVCEAVSETHSLKLIPATQPDLVLVDLDEMNTKAREFIEALREQLAGRLVPILVMSAEPSDGYLVDPGLATGYLQKPFAAKVLLDRVGQALEREVTGSSLGSTENPMQENVQ